MQSFFPLVLSLMSPTGVGTFVIAKEGGALGHVIDPTQNSPSPSPLLSFIFSRMRLAVSLLAWLALVCHFGAFVRAAGCERLVNDTIKDSGMSVSGLSSGAFVSHQFAVAFSSLIDGAGIIAGGPWFSAQANVVLALSLMKDPSLVDVPLLLQEFSNSAKLGYIDPAHCFSSMNIFTFAGIRDSVVHPGVASRTRRFNRALNATTVVGPDIMAEHSFPTLAYGNDCVYLGPMYINSCEYDAAGHALLSSLPGFIAHGPPTLTPVPEDDRNFIRLRQDYFTDLLPPMTAYLAGLDSMAYAYVPTQCRHVLEYSAVKPALIPEGEPDPPAERAPRGVHTAADAAALTAAAAATAPAGGHAPAPSRTTEALLRARSTGLPTLAPGEKYTSDAGGAEKACRVHLALHGCQQTRAQLGNTFSRFTGYNRWAETTNVIVIYPQAIETVTNPKGCWDWWGYSTPAYASKAAPQNVMLARMLTAFRLDTLV
jgi:poly(3-hydroxybutyrate) depolymerase